MQRLQCGNFTGYCDRLFRIARKTREGVVRVMVLYTATLAALLALAIDRTARSRGRNGRLCYSLIIVQRLVSIGFKLKPMGELSNPPPAI